jgi:hypothetical protein
MIHSPLTGAFWAEAQAQLLAQLGDTIMSFVDLVVDMLAIAVCTWVLVEFVKQESESK